MAKLTWSEYYTQVEQKKRNAHDAYMMLSGRSFVTKEQLLWYIDYLSQSSNNVTQLVERCRALEAESLSLEKEANEVIDKYNKFTKLYNAQLEEIAELKGKLEAKDKVIENFSVIVKGLSNGGKSVSQDGGGGISAS